MHKWFLLLIIFFLGFGLGAQEIIRVSIQGKISAPLDEDVESISIYNISSQKGTITNEVGEFELEVAENDRIQITALQFQSFTVIVDKGVIESKRLAIYLNPSVNQLDEVIVRPYDLSGNIIADLNRIKTSAYNPDWDLRYETLEFGYEFSDDQYSSIKGNKAEEAYHNGQEQYGGDLIGLAAGLVSLFIPKSRKKQDPNIPEKSVLTTALRQRFSNAYISEHFDIPEEKVNDFIYFIEDSGINSNLFKAENELLLIDYLTIQSVIYRSQIGNN